MYEEQEKFYRFLLCIFIIGVASYICYNIYYNPHLYIFPLQIKFPSDGIGITEEEFSKCINI